MARVTVEDCILTIPNRFELVLLASQRARDLASGSEETLDRDNDKNPVVALREIAEETIEIEELKDQVIFGLQKYAEADEPEDDSTAILAAAEKEWADVHEPAQVGIGDRAAAAAAAATVFPSGNDEPLAELVGTAGDDAALPAEVETAGDDAAPPAEVETAD